MGIDKIAVTHLTAKPIRLGVVLQESIYDDRHWRTCFELSEMGERDYYQPLRALDRGQRVKANSHQIASPTNIPVDMNGMAG